jgi:carboxyl-terminal processing protease
MLRKLVLKTLVIFVAYSMASNVESAQARAEGPPPTPAAPSPKLPAYLAKRVVAVTEVVLEHHIDPPARQQMVLSGIKGLYRAAGVPIPPGLSRRISMLATSEQLAAFLGDIWPKSTAQPIAVKALEDAMLGGLLGSLPGGAHLVPEKERVVMEQTEGNRYVGIHIALGTNDQEKRPSIFEVIEGGPADRAGVKKGDLIERIDSVDTKGMDLRAAVDRLRGTEGTDVTIQVRQPKTTKPRTYTITRGQHARSTLQGIRKRPTGEWDCRLDAAGPIGYLKISEITASTPHDLRKLARQLDSQGQCGIVLDLRGLGGTSVHSAVLLADTLLAGGVIGRMQTAQREVTFQADADALFRNSPIAVLVDAGTWGTAEWLAAALQDNHRAMIVGVPTYGAMSGNRAGVIMSTDVRSRVSLGNGMGAIDLTTGRLERGDGRPISRESTALNTDIPVSPSRPMDLDKVKTGVKPDHMVGGNGTGLMRAAPLRPEQPPNQEPNIATDEILREAVRLLRKSLERYI